jgi:caffeoyl-CoA O-methyltransferase
MADQDSRAGIRYGTPELLGWVDRLHAPHDAGLARAFEAPEREGLPAIQVGVSEGRTLELLARLAGARLAVEIGTLAGYSALRIARALPPTGHLHSLELDEKHARVARENVRAAGLEGRVTIHVGAALDVLARLEESGPFCLVFIDADKGSYHEYGRWARRALRPGGLLVADNAYLFGRLLDDSAEARAMRAFHEETAASMDSVCVPTPDGLVVAIQR